MLSSFPEYVLASGSLHIYVTVYVQKNAAQSV